MSHRLFRPLLVLLATLLFVSPVQASKKPKNNAKVMITGLYFSGNYKAIKGADEAVRIYNASAFPAKLGGYSISNVYGLSHFKKDVSMAPHCSLPNDFVLEPGQSAWIAKNGKVFKRIFGYNPAIEFENTLPDVPNCFNSTQWPNMPDNRGIVSLHNSKGQLVDIIPYTTGEKDDLPLSRIPPKQWQGGSVMLKGMNIYSWKNQVLRRDTNLQGKPVYDTNTSADWNASSSSAILGLDPYHRVEFPGQSFFAFPPIEEQNVWIKATSAPDNNFAGLTAAMDSATDELLISIYRPSSDFIADHLISALQRGVKIKMLIEGQTVGGLGDDVRYFADRLQKAGAEIYFIGSPENKNIKRRYNFVHTKYMIVDNRLVVLATENWGNSGHPIEPSTGNRGWEVQVASAKLAAQFKQVFNDDVDPENHKDIIGINDSEDDNYGMPFKKAFVLNRSIPHGPYTRVHKAVETTGPARLEIVLSPDNCLDENSGMIKLMNNAKKELYVLENSIPLWWGKGKNGSMADTPNLPLTAVIEAARRGVRTRVLLDGTFYNNEPKDMRDNDDTVRYLNNLAASEGLDLEAKVINLDSTALAKIHAKGLIADRERVHISSINWTENSFKGNREAGILIDQPQIASYYADLFDDDWRHSREHGVEVISQNATLYEQPSKTSGTIATLPQGSRLDVIKTIFQKKAGRWFQVRYEDKLVYLPSEDCSKPLVFPGESFHFINKEVILEGQVKMMKTDGDGHLFSLTTDPKRAPSFFISVKDLPKFTQKGVDPVTVYNGKTVRITGRLKWLDRPTIVVDNPDNIQIVESGLLIPADAPQDDEDAEDYSDEY